MNDRGPENLNTPDEADSPVGEMRLTRRDRIGLRISVLAGMGIIAVGTVAATVSPTLVSYQGST